jgi:hypothetical protein
MEQAKSGALARCSNDQKATLAAWLPRTTSFKGRIPSVLLPLAHFFSRAFPPCERLLAGERTTRE